MAPPPPPECDFPQVEPECFAPGKCPFEFWPGDGFCNFDCNVPAFTAAG